VFFQFIHATSNSNENVMQNIDLEQFQIESRRYISFVKFILQAIFDCLNISLDWNKSEVDYDEKEDNPNDRPVLRDFTEKQKLQEVFNGNNTA
jgi:hypothetical protein